ncbi:tannase and feruloyl esterase [Seiridium cupressi]
MYNTSFIQMMGALADGDATITTDTGVYMDTIELDSWAMVPEGNVNLPKSADGRALWPGYNIGSPLTGYIHILLLGEWSRLFVEKSSTFDPNTITLREYEWLFNQGVDEYDRIIGDSDSDLREFKRHGGKMLTFHGMSDRYVATELLEAYFDAVSSTAEDVNDYYRLFLGPGVYHCSGGPGGQPTALS